MISSVKKAAIAAGALALSVGAVAVAPTLGSAAPAAGSMYTSGWDTGGLYQVDPSDASTTLIGTGALNSSTGLVWDPTTGTMYGMDYDNSPASLYLVDPDTGASSVIASMGIDNPTGMEIQAGTGALFITYDSQGGSMLATVNKTTGAVADIAQVSDGQDDLRIGALAFQPGTGVLYGMGYDDNLYTIDPTTAQATLAFSNIGTGGAIGLTFDCSGATLYAAESDLYTIDLGTGALTTIGELGLVSSDGDFVENLAVVCGTVAPTTTTTAAPTTTSGAVAPAVVTPAFTG